MLKKIKWDTSNKFEALIYFRENIWKIPSISTSEVPKWMDPDPHWDFRCLDLRNTRRIRNTATNYRPVCGALAERNRKFWPNLEPAWSFGSGSDWISTLYQNLSCVNKQVPTSCSRSRLWCRGRNFLNVRAEAETNSFGSATGTIILFLLFIFMPFSILDCSISSSDFHTSLGKA